jgi:hypothetical protein
MLLLPQHKRGAAFGAIPSCHFPAFRRTSILVAKSHIGDVGLLSFDSFVGRMFSRLPQVPLLL